MVKRPFMRFIFRAGNSVINNRHNRQKDQDNLIFLWHLWPVIIVIKLLHILSDFAGHVLTVVIVTTFKTFVTIRTIPRRFMTIMTPVSTSLYERGLPFDILSLACISLIHIFAIHKLFCREFYFLQQFSRVEFSIFSLFFQDF